MGRLNGKVAIITGAASGQGACEAKMFAREGAKVVATDVQDELLKEVVQQINEDGGEAISIKHDVAKSSDWRSVIERTVKKFKRIDILVNNAGIVKSNDILDCEIEEWNLTYDVNATSVFLGMKHVIPEMIKNGQGSIINISSIDSILGISSSAAYTASKGAVRSITKNVAYKYAEHNIRVNSVHPGLVKTPMMKNQIINDKEVVEKYGIPIQRLANPEDIAHGVLFLASDESKYITGTELIIDGGLAIR